MCLVESVSHNDEVYHPLSLVNGIQPTAFAASSGPS
jgi:hypothetical protein